MLDHERVNLSRWLAPLIKTPVTDLFLQINNLQCSLDCAEYELRLIDCLEAYGYHRGKEECRLIIEDMQECMFKVKRLRRLYVMDQERQRQFNSGEREKKYKEEKPPLDLY